MAATAAPTTTTNINWLDDPLDFSPAKPAAKPLDPKQALLQRAKVPERSSTAYTFYPRTPDAVAETAALAKTSKTKSLGVRGRIAKVLRTTMRHKVSKTCHPDCL